MPISRMLCGKLYKIMKPDCNGIEENGISKPLSAPIQLLAAAEGFKDNTREIESIWMMQKSYNLVRNITETNLNLYR